MFDINIKTLQMPPAEIPDSGTFDHQKEACGPVLGQNGVNEDNPRKGWASKKEIFG
ncbi:MAG: hypothetical protein KJ709_02630 [Nanoarchaeota archaeon]|nr:hypothetical protein [Nanoarchaeota archaeon]